jgi:hypothetical protein
VAPFPKEFIKPATEGILEGANNGVVAGLPGRRCIVRIVDGSFHEVDSSEMAFKMAGIFAFKDAMKKAKPILLEPIMGVEVTTPEDYQGDLMGDINRRRGPDSRHGKQDRRVHHHGARSARTALRLRHRHSFAFQGPRQRVHHAFALRAGSELAPLQDRRVQRQGPART